jgi:hypothetical protein
MIRKVVQKHKMDKDFEIRQNLEYWLSRPPEERLEAVEILRRQVYGQDSPDFKELLELLNAHKVEYLVVGGYALAFHGAPRFTGDIDLFVKPNQTNAKLILAVLNEFGFGSLNLSVTDFTSPDNVIQFGVPPVRVDIMTSLTGVSWEKAQAGKVPGNCGDVSVFYIGKTDLITNKKSLGRSKDIADIEALSDK